MIHTPIVVGLLPHPRCGECGSRLPLNYLCTVCVWVSYENADGVVIEVCEQVCDAHR